MKVKDLEFKEWHKSEDDLLVGVVLPGGDKISVLNRITGYGNGQRDIETGYRDKDGKFCLASCMFDIRDYPELSVEDAINKIKRESNNCPWIESE